MLIILFLSNIILTPKMNFGFNFGHYSPTICEFNDWLKVQNKGIIEGNFTVGGHLGVGIRSFFININFEYFNNKSLYGRGKLTLIPIDICLNYTYMVLPFLLYAYGGIGYTLCKIRYSEKNTEEYTTLVDDMGGAIPLRLSIKFMPTKNFSAEILYGYRWTIEGVTPTITDEDIYMLIQKNGELVKELVPIDIRGAFIKLLINREFW